MELFREEYLSRLGPNVGSKIYERLKAREQENLSKNLLANKVVQDALDFYPDTTVLDASHIYDLTEADQCNFFHKYSSVSIKCKHLRLRDWTFMSDKILRSISISLGETLQEIDLTASAINGDQFEILIARIPKLKILHVSKCPNVDGKCMNLLSKYAGSSLHELYASECPLFKYEPLQWIAGALGINAKKLTKLSVLDLAESPVEDRGAFVLGTGLSNIRFLNLCNCSDIQDYGIISIIKSNLKLAVLNLCGCLQITNKAIITLSNCSELVSLNLSRCEKVSDKAILILAQHCAKLQALNLSGLVKLSEESLCALVTYCHGLLMLNITGCELISIDGLRQLIRGVPYVEAARTYFGFKPVDDHVNKKLADQLQFRRDVAAASIQHSYKAAQDRREMALIALEKRQDEAARLIQSHMRCYRQRMVFFKKWIDRKQNAGALFIQRIWRGVLGRRHALHCREVLNNRQKLSVQVTVIQKHFRGYLHRKRNNFVANAIMNMYFRRRKEAETALTVRIQSVVRRSLAMGRSDIQRELRHRRNLVEFSAALVMQCTVRVFLSKMRTLYKRIERQRAEEVRERSAIRIQSFYRACTGRSMATQTAFEIKLRKIKRDKNARKLQRIYRGYLGRQKALKRRIYIASLHHAATTIQRIYRGSLVMHWRDMRMNIISAFILDRQYLERRDRMVDTRLRYKRFLYDISKDSASDDEPEEVENPWIKYYDENQKCDYWYNGATQEITYEEPRSSIHFELQMIGRNVRIYWPMQREWYTGVVSKYHRVKEKHRIDYEDGDHEWLVINKEKDRVQIQLDDGSYVMYRLYRPPDMQEDDIKLDEKKQQEEFLASCWRDAQQWRRIVDDKTQEVIYLSTISGEIRAAKDDADNWVIQDDGFGFPAFYNVRTLETVHEDPRFTEDSMEHIKRQQAFIMHELRYNLYFCKDYWQQYTTALRLNDDKRIFIIMKTVAKSPKPKMLASLVLQAKVAHKPASLVDRVTDEMEEVQKEIEYASWLVERLAELTEKSLDAMTKGKEAKMKVLKTLIKNDKTKVFCFYCKHETKKNLTYCPTCGKPQVFM